MVVNIFELNKSYDGDGPETRAYEDRCQRKNGSGENPKHAEKHKLFVANSPRRQIGPLGKHVDKIALAVVGLFQLEHDERKLNLQRER